METIYQGETWEYEVEITEDDEAMDCDGLTVKLWLKESLSETADEIYELDINWTDQSNGKGYTNLTYTQSKALEVRTYWFEVKLIDAVSYEVVRVLKQDRLKVKVTLEKDLS